MSKHQINLDNRVFGRGKYKGKEIKEIIYINPTYVLWYHENVEEIAADLYIEAEAISYAMDEWSSEIEYL